VLFVGSANSVESQWCFAELAMARSLGKPIVPVSVSGDVAHPLLADIQHVVLENEQDLERVERGLQSLQLDPESSFAWDPQRSPFLGWRRSGSATRVCFSVGAPRRSGCWSC
jgi:hypothetical protein